VHVDHFSFGLVTPTLSYTLSVLGSLLGLVCTVRARNMTDKRRRARWLLLAAWAIGGTGIWTMHFMAMLGFTVSDLTIRYDLATTVASWMIAIVVVGIGLFIVGFGRPSAAKILTAGTLTGLGVAGMHYTGMAAMRMPATVVYDQTLVIASVVIAVVAATVALWFTVTLRRGIVLFAAALIMGVAVNGMHFTGMFAMSVSDPTGAPVSGFLPFLFVVPIAIFVVAVVIVLATALINRSGTSDGEGEGGPGDTAPRPPTQPVDVPAQRRPQPGRLAEAFGPRPGNP
jgi:NO-binding membrane sensor protein with MHYT domain